MVTRAGFTLVEVVVALVVLEVGILGVLGALTVSARMLQRAERLERAVAEVERTYDSLTALATVPGSGERIADGGTVRWEVGGDGWARIEFLVADSALVAVEARLEPGAP